MRKGWIFSLRARLRIFSLRARLHYAAYEATRALAKLGQRVEWPEGMYPPGGAIAACHVMR